jgi:hypothetical protein
MRKIINIVLIVLVVVMAYVTCKNLQKSAAPATTAAPVEVEKEGHYPFSTSHVINSEHPDTVQGTYQVRKAPVHVDVPWDKITRPSTSRRAFMSTGWWSAKMAYQPSDTTVHQNYLHKWLKFKDDQTFDIYVNNQLLETGHWSFDDDKKIIYISCKDPYFNNTWATQERGFRMVWKGNTDLNASGIQVRMDNEPSPKW